MRRQQPGFPTQTGPNPVLEAEQVAHRVHPAQTSLVLVPPGGLSESDAGNLVV